MRKLTLPLLAVCAVFAASAPVATAAPSASASGTSKKVLKKLSDATGALKALEKAVSLIDDVNSGQTGSINGVDARVTTVVANLTALDNKVTAVIAASTAALTALQKGLTDLAAAVQGPNVAGQLGAAGSTPPGPSNSATPDTLPAGTLYRQIAVNTATTPPTPIGGRIWMKMAPPGSPAPAANRWACIAADDNIAFGVPSGTVTCDSQVSG